MTYIYFYIPFLFLSIIIVGLGILIQRRYKFKPQTGIPITSGITAIIFAFFGILGARMVLDEHFIHSLTTPLELIGVYKTALFGIIYGLLMGLPFYKVTNDFYQSNSSTPKSVLAGEFVAVCLFISVGLCYVLFYYMVWVMI